ncbi:MAG: phosphoenolpyruvate--protein phosphotransferase [Anaerolineae bacterium]
MGTLRGIAASQGVAIGPVFCYREVELEVVCAPIADPAGEWARLEEALSAAREELALLRAKTIEEVGEEEAAIFEAHAMMLEDPELLKAVRTTIETEQVNAECALERAAEQYAQALEALDDEYLRARAVDVRDVTNRVLRLLLGLEQRGAKALQKPSIVVARDLTPSDTALLDKSLVLGFLTAEGGPTSHTAILARSLGIPAVLGVGSAALALEEGETVVIDGDEGVVHVAPNAETRARYERKQDSLAAVTVWARRQAHEPAVTEDGKRVEVVANIGNLRDARAAIEEGAEGVGLLRTEFLYLERSDLPDEEEQAAVYAEITDLFDGAPVILRTLDVGGDKDLPAFDLPREMNPFLGLRALRLGLAHPEEIFKPQLRAVLRAAVDRNLKVMFPMVASVTEVRAARTLLETCRAELQAEGVAVPEDLEVGIMVEIPAAALMADHLASDVDFFSIGTNDLTQYTMAADRTNAAVSYLTNGLEPAVLRLVKMVIDAAHARGKWVGMCGELAGEPLALPILLGLGLDEFSMNPPAIPIAKQILRALSYKMAQQVARRALELETADEVEAFVRAEVAAVDVQYLLALKRHKLDKDFS